MNVRPIVRATLAALFATGVGVAGAQTQTSPTDGRTGGTGPTSATPQTDRSLPGNAVTGTTPSTRDAATARDAVTRNDRNTPSATNPTDGRNSGTGPMGNNPRTDQAVDQRSNLGNRNSSADGYGSSASSERVRQVQQALEAKGHDVGGVDGIMGPRTQSALRDYQQSQGMRATGRLDTATLGALGIDDDGMHGTRSRGMNSRDTTSGATSPSTGTSATGTTPPRTGS